MQNDVSCADAEQRLKNHVAAIKSAAEILQDNENIPEKERVLFLKAIIEEVERLDREVADIFTDQTTTDHVPLAYFRLAGQVLSHWFDFQRSLSSGTFVMSTRS